MRTRFWYLPMDGWISGRELFKTWFSLVIIAVGDYCSSLQMYNYFSYEAIVKKNNVVAILHFVAVDLLQIKNCFYVILKKNVWYYLSCF